MGVICPRAFEREILTADEPVVAGLLRIGDRAADVVPVFEDFTANAEFHSCSCSGGAAHEAGVAAGRDSHRYFQKPGRAAGDG